MGDKLQFQYNTRMSMIWSVIERSIDFNGKRVVDLGCGRGDLCMKTYIAGAEFTLGIDKTLKWVIETKAWSDKVRPYITGLDFRKMNIDVLVGKVHRFRPSFDIAFCMSVLPYLNDYRSALRWLRSEFKQSVIECQYFGDGPGKPWVRDDAEMRSLLEWTGWSSVEIIGGSHVTDRNKIRTIWLCQ